MSGVLESVGGDALGSDPEQVLVEAVPEVVVAAAGQGAAVAVAQQLIGGRTAPRLVACSARLAASAAGCPCSSR